VYTVNHMLNYCCRQVTVQVVNVGRPARSTQHAGTRKKLCSSPASVCAAVACMVAAGCLVAAMVASVAPPALRSSVFFLKRSICVQGVVLT
jgi:hypothetical protein